MSNKIFNIDFNLGNVLDSDGGILMTTPTISYQAAPNWELHFVENVDTAGLITPIDVSQAVSWNAAVDVDFTDETQPMIRTLPSAIITSGAASGIIVVPLDANTDTFYQKINGRNTIPAYFEIRGRDSNDRVIYDYRFRINALGAIDPQGGEPLPVASGGVTMADVYALLRSATEYRFSDDGENWHPTQQAGDNYYQSRYPDGDWSDTIEIVAGAPGHNVQFKYSADGTTFHENPLSSDYYMSMSNDGGSTWTSGILFHGADGEDGTDGTNGVGFKLLGSYDGSTTYHPITTSGYYECVLSNGSTFAYINDEASSGHMPPTGALSDSYWQMIARKGEDGSGGGTGTVYAEDVIGLDAFISGQVSASYYDKDEIDEKLVGYMPADSTYSKSAIDTKLSSKADLSAVYTKTTADNLLSAKADKSTTYTKTEVDNALSSKANANNVYTKSETNTAINNATSSLVDESDLLDYTPITTYNAGIEAVNARIDNIGTGLPYFKTMPTPQSNYDDILYLGTTDTGSAYIGPLYTNDITSMYEGDTMTFNIVASLARGTERVWRSSQEVYMNTDQHRQIVYKNGAWTLQSITKTGVGPDDWSDPTDITTLTIPSESGVAWGTYITKSMGISVGVATIVPSAFAAGEKCHLYEKNENYEDVNYHIDSIVLYRDNTLTKKLKRCQDNGTNLYVWSPTGNYPHSNDDYPQIYRTTPSGGMCRYVYDNDESDGSWSTSLVPDTTMPWELPEDTAWTRVVSGNTQTIHIKIKRIDRSSWTDLGKITT